MSPVTAYADLEIRILQREAAGYPVEMTLDGEQEFPRGLLDPAALPLPWVATADSAADGERLFRWLTGDPRLAAAWAEVRGRRSQRRIRLRIDAGVPELHAIPWELLSEPPDGDPMGLPSPLGSTTATPFSRYLAGRWVPGGPVFARPLKVLCAVASPANLADFGVQPLDAGAEWTALQAALSGLDVQLTRFPLEGAAPLSPAADAQSPMANPCTLPALEAALRAGGYHVLHVIAHGAYSEQAGKAMLYLADEQNRVKLVEDADLAAMLARAQADTAEQAENRLRLVFLAACQTATRSPADAFRGLAPQLVAAGVPAVMAMQDVVPVDTARQFATTFYRQLLAHGMADLAANEARSALLTAQLPGAAIPVLFMRLRDGLLLGQRGIITSDREEMFWPFLLANVEQGLCTAFLGPRVTAGLLPPAETVAIRLADKYRYPMADRADLASVAQYIAVTDPILLRNDYLRLLQRGLFGYLGIRPTEEQKRSFGNAGLDDTIAGLNWAELSLTIQEAELHHLLAELPLPLYVTTNADSFMFEALRQCARPARRAGPRWAQPDAGPPQYVITPPPSPENPVVFHLNGYDADPEQREHVVLSEDDYMAHFVRLSRDQETILPMNVLRMLSEHSFLFLGYGIEDWEFRVLLQGLIRPIAQTARRGKLHVGVQLDVEQTADVERARAYLERYLGRFNIDIYWGTPQQFVAELHSRWHEQLEAGDGWGA